MGTGLNKDKNTVNTQMLRRWNARLREEDKA